MGNPLVRWILKNKIMKTEPNRSNLIQLGPEFNQNRPEPIRKHPYPHPPDIVHI